MKSNDFIFRRQRRPNESFHSSFWLTTSRVRSKKNSDTTNRVSLHGCVRRAVKNDRPRAFTFRMKGEMRSDVISVPEQGKNASRTRSFNFRREHLNRFPLPYKSRNPLVLHLKRCPPRHEYYFPRDFTTPLPVPLLSYFTLILGGVVRRARSWSPWSSTTPVPGAISKKGYPHPSRSLIAGPISRRDAILDPMQPVCTIRYIHKPALYNNRAEEIPLRRQSRVRAQCYKTLGYCV